MSFVKRLFFKLVKRYDFWSDCLGGSIGWELTALFCDYRNALYQFFNRVFFLLTSMGEGYDFPEKADTGGLYPQDYEKKGQQKYGAIAEGIPHEEFL